MNNTTDNFTQKFCKENGFQLEKILEKNDRKKTLVILVRKEKNSRLLIIKLFFPNAPSEIKLSFKKELDFYKKNFSEYLPKLETSGENFIGLSFFDGIPLPKYIQSISSQKQDFDLKLFLQRIHLMLDSFFFLNKVPDSLENKDEEIFVERLYNRIGNLISSGPKETKKNNFESFVLRQTFKMISSNLKIKLQDLVRLFLIEKANLRSSYGHNDLHCNNILINSNYRIIPIDFEHLSTPGTWLSDYLYFIATLTALFSSNSYAKKMIKNYAIEYILRKEPKLKRFANSLLEIFCSAGEANSRFRFETGINLQKILNFSKSIKKLKVTRH